jgi:alkylation response protein AidB-like acyl-CoA dehydrogenase
MYDLHLSAEQLEIRDTVRDFVAHEIKPITLRADRLDAGDRRLSLDLLDKASRMGLRALALPEALGGAGADTLTRCIVGEELAVGDADLAAVLMQTAALAPLLLNAMTPEQRQRFLPQFLNDDRTHLALAVQEPESDDALGVNYHRPTAIGAAIRTTAMRSGDSWIVNGLKSCVANAPLARLFAVRVKTDAEGERTLLVERDSPGLAVREHAGHWQHGACGDLVFEDCRVPAANLLGPEGGRLPESDDRRVAQFAALNLGIGRAAYEAAFDYAQLRVQGGRPIIEHQAIGTKLADIAIRLEVARNAIWKAAWACDHADARADRSLADLPLATIARVVTGEAVLAAAKDAAECFGAMGVMRDMPLQKYVQDARICLHSGYGPRDARLRIAEALVRYRRPALPVAAE